MYYYFERIILKTAIQLQMSVARKCVNNQTADIYSCSALSSSQQLGQSGICHVR